MSPGDGGRLACRREFGGLGGRPVTRSSLGKGGDRRGGTECVSSGTTERNEGPGSRTRGRTKIFGPQLPLRRRTGACPVTVVSAVTIDRVEHDGRDIPRRLPRDSTVRLGPQVGCGQVGTDTLVHLCNPQDFVKTPVPSWILNQKTQICSTVPNDSPIGVERRSKPIILK